MYWVFLLNLSLLRAVMKSRDNSINNVNGSFKIVPCLKLVIVNIFPVAKCVIAFSPTSVSLSYTGLILDLMSMYYVFHKQTRRDTQRHKERNPSNVAKMVVLCSNCIIVVSHVQRQGSLRECTMSGGQVPSVDSSLV